MGNNRGHLVSSAMSLEFYTYCRKATSRCRFHHAVTRDDSSNSTKTWQLTDSLVLPYTPSATIPTGEFRKKSQTIQMNFHVMTNSESGEIAICAVIDRCPNCRVTVPSSIPAVAALNFCPGPEQRKECPMCWKVRIQDGSYVRTACTEAAFSATFLNKALL